MNGKPSLKLISEFDGMLEDSVKGLSHETTFSVCTSNLTGTYVIGDWYIYSNKTTSEFGFVESIGKINQRGKGTIMSILGTNHLYISESGWYSAAETREIGQPIFYVLDMHGNVQWESKLDSTYAIDVIEVLNEHILILSQNGMDASVLWKFDNVGQLIWKMNLNRVIVKPTIDKENNIYIKHGSVISKISFEGKVLWNIDLGSDSGCYWESFISNSEGIFFGYQKNFEHFLIKIGYSGNIISKQLMSNNTQCPAIDDNKKVLYFIMNYNILVAFSITYNQIIYQAVLKKESFVTPIIYNDLIIICYEKRVAIYSNDLNLLYTYNLKGVIKSTGITKNGVLQILVSDYLSWDRGKSNISYSRLYEINGK